jgi:thioredoxin-like negative regulator of GroEL
MKPIVDGIEEEFKGRLLVQRVNIQDPAGKYLAQKYGFQATPTFIMFDSQGVEEWRSLGRIDRDKVQQFMESYR